MFLVAFGLFTVMVAALSQMVIWWQERGQVGHNHCSGGIRSCLVLPLCLHTTLKLPHSTLFPRDFTNPYLPYETAAPATQQAGAGGGAAAAGAGSSTVEGSGECNVLLAMVRAVVQFGTACVGAAICIGI